jgi:hypothetical protein
MSKKKKHGLDEVGWNGLVECFRKGESTTDAARNVGVDRKTAKKALEDGYPPGRIFPEGKAPISQVLESDRAMERVKTEEALFLDQATDGGKLADRLLDAVTKAADSVVRSHASSGVRIHLAGKSTEAALTSALRLQAAGNLLAQRMSAQIEELASSDQALLKNLDLEECIGYLREIAKFTRDSAETMRIVDDMERRHLGKTGDIRSLLLDITKTEGIPADEADHIVKVGMQMLGHDDASEHVDLDSDPNIIEAEYEELQKGVKEYEHKEDDTEDEDGDEEDGGEEEEEEEWADVEGHQETGSDL